MAQDLDGCKMQCFFLNILNRYLQLSILYTILVDKMLSATIYYVFRYSFIL